MDLVMISRKIWRHRIATLPVIALTLLGMFYVIAIKSPVYNATATYILINPPPPPTPEDIARKPSLAHISPDNPFTRFSDQSAVVGLLSSVLSNDTERRALASKGADPRYTVGPSQSGIGYSSQILEVTGVGSSAPAAIQTAQVVGTALGNELERLQEARGVAPLYTIKAELITAPDTAQQRVSGKLRALIGVLVLGVVLLFVSISVAEGLAILREGHGEKEPAKQGRRNKPRNGRSEKEPAKQAWWNRAREGRREPAKQDGRNKTSAGPQSENGHGALPERTADRER